MTFGIVYIAEKIKLKLKKGPKLWHVSYMIHDRLYIEAEGWIVSGLSMSMSVLLHGSKRFKILLISNLNSFTEN